MTARLIGIQTWFVQVWSLVKTHLYSGVFNLLPVPFTGAVMHFKFFQISDFLDLGRLFIF